MSDNNNMMVHRGVRYRLEDAIRLGLVSRGVILTKASVQVPAAPPVVVGSTLITTQALNPETVDKSTSGAEVVDKSTSDESTGDTSTVDESTTDQETVDSSTSDSRPAGNASKAAWAAYALEHGATAEQLEGLTRDQIAAL